MTNINLRATLNKIAAAGFSLAFHTDRRPVFLQKQAAVEACFAYGIEPVRN